MWLRGAMVAIVVALACTLTGRAAAADMQAPKIHLRAVGTGAKCWVLLHPFGASGRFWEQRAARLARERAVRILYPDLPSHGRSRLVPRFDYAAAARELRAALARSCPRPEIVIGASSGGIVAMKLGAALRVKVAAIGVGWSFTAANIAAMNAIAKSVPPETAAFHAAFAEQGEAQIAALQRHYGDLAATGLAPFLSRREAAALEGRLLVLQGTRDDFFLAPTVRDLVAHIRGGRLEPFAEAGHLQPLAPPHADRTWSLVAEFAASP